MDKKNSRISTKQSLEALWDSFVDALLEPIFVTITILLLSARIQNIMDFLTTHPAYSFWQVLETDIHMNSAIYIGFAAVYILWVVSKGIKYRRDKRESKKLDNIGDTLEKMNTTLNDLQKAIKDLPSQIAESIRSTSKRDKKSR
jgi:hypothetical protein